ncbi:MAG: 3-oxoacyl-[acyl-carrier-protein] synthase 3 [Thermoleophilia bacterium]|nr:3-oxoacyl-[acyl-carrier-protein] synthase 3 [Thermoleophilia bacterium]
MTSFDTWPPIAIVGTGAHAAPHDDQATDSTERAAVAARRAMHSADIRDDEVDLVIVATSTSTASERDTSAPPQPFASARAIHVAVGLRDDAGAIDVVESGAALIHALATGASLLAAAEAWTHVLVVGSDDAAGALVLRKELEVADVVALAAFEAGIEPGAAFDRGIDGGPLDHETTGLRSLGFLVESEARTNAIATVVRAACRDASIEVGELRFLVPQRQDRRAAYVVTDELELPDGRIAFAGAAADVSGARGAGGASSIPRALDQAQRANQLRSGDLVCLVAGNDAIHAACVVRWS